MNICKNWSRLLHSWLLYIASKITLGLRKALVEYTDIAFSKKEKEDLKEFELLLNKLKRILAKSKN